jgi:hypothetical protein
MDGSMHNIRVMRNILINSASHPMSTQPSVGGPIYWIRNIVYHAPGGSTRMTAGSPGVIFYNNTITSEINPTLASNVHWRNNLVLGQDPSTPIFNVTTTTAYSSSDYNGFRPNPAAPYAFGWNVVKAEDAGRGRGADPEDGGAAGRGRGGAPAQARAPQPWQYRALADYSAATGQDTHSVVVDYDVFVNVPKLDRDPKTVQRLYTFKDVDFRLRPGSAAIDRGVVIPNVTDGFTGRAPDLGALEFGAPLPTYGPRP